MYQRDVRTGPGGSVIENARGLPIRRRTTRPWLGFAIAALLVAAVACGGGGHQPAGCLGTEGADVAATVGKPVQITASVAGGPCAEFPISPQDDNLFKDEIVVGDVVRLRLLAPLLPVRIEPISTEVQPLHPERPEATWRWQVVADRPGMHRLSIVASVVEPDGGEVVLENREIQVRLHADGTVAYYAGRMWDGLTMFVMSAQGVVAAIAAGASAVGGAWLARRRARRGREPEPEVPAQRDRDPSGYL